MHKFVYDNDSGKVIDSDIKLDTLEDIEKVIKQNELEIQDLEGDLERISSPGAELSIKKDIRKFQQIQKSLLDLRKRNFGI